MKLVLSINNRIAAVRQTNPGYVSALTTGYLLILVTMGVQFTLTPMYLSYLGEEQFGQLMVMLNLISYIAVGITWMTGGLVRLIGEAWTRGDVSTFRNLLGVGRYVYTLYALLVVAVVAAGCALVQGAEALPSTWLLAGLYLVLHYEALPERQAFIGTNLQAAGNSIELARVLVGGVCIAGLLIELETLAAVWCGLLLGCLLQRVLTSLYWTSRVGETGWRRFRSGMRPVFLRLTGRQGAGYVAYGALLLTLQADTVIVSILGGAEMAGRFVLLWKIPEAIGLLLWKVPSAMEPGVIAQDAKGNHLALREQFRAGRLWFLALVLGVSLLYMIAGSWLARLWVGEFAPESGWLYLAAAGALFCNTFARWPISFAFAMVRLTGLIRVAAVEVAGKIGLTALLFPKLGIGAPVVATIIVHLLYVGWGYQRTVRFREEST